MTYKRHEKLYLKNTCKKCLPISLGLSKKVINMTWGRLYKKVIKKVIKSFIQPAPGGGILYGATSCVELQNRQHHVCIYGNF